jgi:peptidoglycan/xylan/chitin deacetylase (PgdA/CDA1 family)
LNAHAALRLARARVAEERARRSRRRVGIALIYHRVAEAGGSPAFELNPAIGRAAFRRELAYVRRRYRVVSPSDLPHAVATRRTGERLPVAITFDDDTRSHVDEAAPALDELGLVAGFYVGGWSLHPGARPWWETLQLAVDHGRLAAGLPLPPSDAEAARRREPGALRRLGAFVEALDLATRRDVQAELAAATDDLTADPGLDEHALRSLAARHEIGFHPRAHDRLVPLGDVELAAALTDGRHALEDVVGRGVSSVAYPHGAADERVAAAARAAGYTHGFAGFNRAVSASDDALLLPRLDPWHTSLGTFAITLSAATLAT